MGVELQYRCSLGGQSCSADPKDAYNIVIFLYPYASGAWRKDREIGRVNPRPTWGEATLDLHSDDCGAMQLAIAQMMVENPTP